MPKVWAYLLLIAWFIEVHNCTQCTPKVLGYSLQLFWFIKIHSHTVHQHWLLPCLWLYWHIVLVLHQNSDVCKWSLLTKPQTWGLLQGLLPKDGGCPCCGFSSYSDWPTTGHSDLNVSEQPQPRLTSLKTRVHLQQVWTEKGKRREKELWCQFQMSPTET